MTRSADPSGPRVAPSSPAPLARVPNPSASDQVERPVDGAGPRSRLSPERETELFEVTLALLAEEGYERLGMDAVAHRAHTSKATIYRQWNGKGGLVVAALRHLQDPDEPLPDTGSLRGDLLAVARSLGSVAVEHGRIVAAASHAVQVDPDVAAAVRERVVAPGVAKLSRLLARAVERGEVLPDHPALDHVPELIVAAFLARPLLEGRPADEAYLSGLVESVALPALIGPRHRPPSTRERPHGHSRS